MSVKPAHSHKETGPSDRGKGLDALDRFIIQNWPPSSRFGLWCEHQGHLSVPKTSLEHFLNAHLEDIWNQGEAGAVITIDPPNDPFVVIRVDFDHKHLSQETKYKPSHWSWKVVPVEQVVGILGAAAQLDLPAQEKAYLEGLRDGKLSAAWGAQATEAKA
jgi:hypothetical protein